MKLNGKRMGMRRSWEVTSDMRNLWLIRHVKALIMLHSNRSMIEVRFGGLVAVLSGDCVGYQATDCMCN